MPTARPRRTRPAVKRRSRTLSRIAGGIRSLTIRLILAAAFIAAVLIGWFHGQYTISVQSPIQMRFQLPFVIAQRVKSTWATQAQTDQHGHGLTAWQQYACRKFGPDCRVALAIQRAENPRGKCEIYHYNADGTLDWGYFQINTVHLQRPGLNLRDLLDCKANIDFAYQLYREHNGFTPWSTYNSGLYRKFIATD